MRSYVFISRQKVGILLQIEAEIFVEESRIQLYQHHIRLNPQQDGINTITIEIRTRIMFRPHQANFSLALYPTETTKNKQTKYQTFFIRLIMVHLSTKITLPFQKQTALNKRKGKITSDARNL